MAVTMTEGRMASCDGKNSLYTVTWRDPDKEVRGIVQISHGMCEYVKRYDEMARYLAEAGFVVAGNDHLGHGQSVASESDLGFIAEKDGYLLMVKDLRQMTDRLHEEYPGKPLVLYGHSMGSFLARQYAATYADGVDAYVFSGTAGPNPAAGAGKALIGILSAFKGERHVSKLLGKMSFGSYCARIPDAPTGKEWVTSDPERLDAYTHDPHCMFDFTLSAYRDLMNTLQFVSDPGWAPKLRKDLPYYLVYGSEDPVGAYGEGVKTVYGRMKEAGCEKAEIRAYEGMRHEPHNEVGREAFFADTLAWIEKALNL